MASEAAIAAAVFYGTLGATALLVLCVAILATADGQDEPDGEPAPDSE